jgi:hypothetical protein
MKETCNVIKVFSFSAEVTVYIMTVLSQTVKRFDRLIPVSSHGQRSDRKRVTNSDNAVLRTLWLAAL